MTRVICTACKGVGFIKKDDNSTIDMCEKCQGKGYLVKE